MICLVGDMEDLSLVYVRHLLEEQGHRCLPLSENQFGKEWSFRFCDSDIQNGALECQKNSYSIHQLKGAFLRFTPHPCLPYDLNLAEIQQEVFLSERRQAINYFLNTLTVPVVNRPYSGISNASKPYQMMRLAAAGFRVPEWIATNDVTTARSFLVKFDQRVVCKSCSGLRSQVKLADEMLLSKIQRGTSPVVLQQYVDGFDVRVHTVGDQVFPTKIISSGVDYRFESHDITYQPTIISSDLADLCRSMAAQEGLVIAGFDFRVTKQRDWFCLEMNPVPTFLPYEMMTGQPIGQAIVQQFIPE